ncbi:hypothetical protein AcV7_005789 [Taiwanofungus camphoratus]|nr:hypothetical protein AcV7_005789 [Antrodia cinnamomea]
MYPHAAAPYGTIAAVVRARPRRRRAFLLRACWFPVMRPPAPSHLRAHKYENCSSSPARAPGEPRFVCPLQRHDALLRWFHLTSSPRTSSRPYSRTPHHTRSPAARACACAASLLPFRRLDHPGKPGERCSCPPCGDAGCRADIDPCGAALQEDAERPASASMKTRPGCARPGTPHLLPLTRFPLRAPLAFESVVPRPVDDGVPATAQGCVVGGRAHRGRPALPSESTRRRPAPPSARSHPGLPHACRGGHSDGVRTPSPAPTPPFPAGPRSTNTPATINVLALDPSRPASSRPRLLPHLPRSQVRSSPAESPRVPSTCARVRSHATATTLSCLPVLPVCRLRRQDAVRLGHR